MFSSTGFPRRHIGPRPQQAQMMLKTLGYASPESFLSEVIPQNLLSSFSPSFFDEPLSENQALQELKDLLAKNTNYDCYLGMGFIRPIFLRLFKEMF